MQKEDGVFTVPCKINGLNLKFIFDTGASDVSISLTEAMFMLKNGYLKNEDVIGKEYYQNATGEITAGTKILLKEVEFAGLKLYNVDASVVNTLGAPLLLGQSAMMKLGKFQLDPNSGTITILNGISTSSYTFDYSNNNNKNCNRYVDGDSTKTTAPYSIYREFFKKNLYDEALPYWRIIFEKAPGFRAQTFVDGEVMYASSIQNTADKALKEKYIDTLFLIYDKRAECHGLVDYVLGKKAVDMIKYRSDIKGARPLLEKSLVVGGNNAYPFVIQTYFKLLINQLGNDGITADLVINKYDELSKVLDYNISKPDNKQLQAYKDVKSSLDELFTQNFADKSDPADCAKLLEIYKKKYAENPNDLETVKTVYNKTRGCGDSLFNVELLVKLNAMNPSYSYAVRLGNIYMKVGKMDSAFTLYQNAVVKETDSSKKADLYFIMANIRYEKNDFPSARDFAKQSIQYNPQMGKAYLLIGVLYAASGKLCGPGTGFQSQIVLWPAFDYFKKAIETGQEDAVPEAQKMISTYTEFLPTKADLLKKKLSIGAPYTVNCWINEETTVKAR